MKDEIIEDREINNIPDSFYYMKMFRKPKDPREEEE